MTMLSRSILASVLLATLLLAGAGPARSAGGCAAWESFKTRFVTANGRVVDTANDRISHSEGQGYGMLLAVAHDDPAAFARIFEWTYANLMIRSDGLLVWKWTPNGEQRYTDTNSASDGDLLVAYALLEAGERFDNARYTRLGRDLAAQVRDLLIEEVGGYTVLLPGPAGFRRDDGSVYVNLSYWVFPALARLAESSGADVWETLARDGRRLIRKARFGPWKLPPDWAVLTTEGSVRLPGADAPFGPDFGYNAVRIPLYLAWADRGSADELLRPFQRFWEETRSAAGLPLVVNLAESEIVSRGRNVGYEAVHDLIAPGRRVTFEGPSGGFAEGTQYYDAVLKLLACLAEQGDSPCACGA